MARRLACLAVATLLWGAWPTPAAQAAECPPEGGTTVVVDFADLGGGVVVGCAPTASTGFEALAEAGFDTEPVQENPAFVCRIDGRPGPDAEDCVDIPPDSAFWSYWTADLGGDWRFNTSGASGSIAGDLEGWAFATGSAQPPRHAVPATTTTTTTASTTTTTTSPTTTTSSTTSTTSTTTTTVPSTTTTSTTAAATTTTGSTTTEPSTTTSAPTTSTTVSTTPPTTTAAASTPTEGGAGGFLLGAVVVVGLGAASWIIARRRAEP